MKILVITENFPPSSAISARRWGELAPLLSNYAYQVSVLHRQDCGFAIKVFESGKLISEQYFHDSGVSENAATDSKKKPTNSSAKSSRLSSYVAVPRFIDSSWRRWLKALTIRPLFKHIRMEGFDYTVASYGPGGPVILGYVIKLLLKSKFLIDFRDSLDAKRALSGPFVGLSLALERFLVKSADRRITIGVKLASYLSETYQSRVLTIYNGLSDANSGPVVENSRATRLYYAGTIYGHRLSAFQLLLSHLRRSPNFTLTLRLLGENLAEVDELVSTEGVVDQVEILGPTTKKIIESEMDDNSLPVVLEVLASDQPDWIYGNVTGKLFELASRYSYGLVIANSRSESFQLAEMIDGWCAIESEADFSKLQCCDFNAPSLNWRDEFSFSRQAKNLWKTLR